MSGRAITNLVVLLRRLARAELDEGYNDVADGLREAADRLADVDQHMRRIMTCAESYNSRIGVYGNSDLPEWILAYTPTDVAHHRRLPPWPW